MRWPSLSNVSRSDLMSSGSSSTRSRRRRCFGRNGTAGRTDEAVTRNRNRKDKPNRCTFARLALNFNLGAVALYHAVHHGQAKTGTALALGGEKRFQATLLGVFVHAHARVAHVQSASAWLVHCSFCGAGEEMTRVFKRERATFGHGVHGVEDQVGERVADFTLRAYDAGQIRTSTRFEP